MCAGLRADRDEPNAEVAGKPWVSWEFCLAFGGKINELGQNFETGAEVQRAGRDTQISRGQGAEPSGS